MIYTEVFEAVVGASALDSEIGKLEVPDGFRITILELGFTLPSDSWIYGYIGEIRVDKIHGSYKLVDLQRIIVNRELVAGQTFKITSTSITGGQTSVLVVYDKSTR